MMRFDDLDGRVAIVTGSSSGIGREVAVAMARQGMKVVVNGRTGDRLADVERDIRELGGEMLAYPTDIRRSENVQALIDATVERFGGVDVVVNSAGGTYNAAPETITDKGWHTVLDINLSGPFFLARAAFPHLLQSPLKSLIFIGSIGGIEPGPGHLHYSVAKAGVTHMTRVLAFEWGKYGIRVNCISPGVIRGPNSQFVGNAEMEQRWRNRVPMGWIGRPADIVGAVLMLASLEASAYTTGTNIRIDGGPRSGTTKE